MSSSCNEMENGKSSIFLLVPFTFLKNFCTHLPLLSIFETVASWEQKKCIIKAFHFHCLGVILDRLLPFRAAKVKNQYYYAKSFLNFHSIQCKEEASPSDDSKIVTSNGDLADTQCATNTSNNRSSQETNDAEEVTKEATNPDDHLTIATKPENVQPDPDSDPNPDSKPDNNDLKNHNNEQSDHDSDDLDEKMDPYTFSEDEEEEGDTNQMGVGGSASLSR